MERKPIGLSVPMRITMETPEEKEAFNDVERRSKVKQEILNNPSKEAKLIAEVTMLTEAVRILSKKVDELEKKQ